MFQFLQTHMKKIFWGLLFLIIPPFCFYFNVRSGNQDEVVGEIFGKPVKFSDFRKAYTGVSIEMILRYGNNFNRFLFSFFVPLMVHGCRPQLEERQ